MYDDLSELILFESLQQVKDLKLWELIILNVLLYGSIILFLVLVLFG